jgi:NADH-quinone oxidoreductase subunit L
MFDRQGVDDVVEGTALGVGGTGSVLRLVQTGFVRSYALSLLIGTVIVVLALLAVNAA